jgi:hypothetical protein
LNLKNRKGKKEKNKWNSAFTWGQHPCLGPKPHTAWPISPIPVSLVYQTLSGGSPLLVALELAALAASSCKDADVWVPMPRRFVNLSRSCVTEPATALGGCDRSQIAPWTPVSAKLHRHVRRHVPIKPAALLEPIT